MKLTIKIELESRVRGWRCLARVYDEQGKYTALATGSKNIDDVLRKVNLWAEEEVARKASEEGSK